MDHCISTQQQDSVRETEDWVLGSDPAIRRVWQHAKRASEVGCTVLVSGETGTGKEVWAKLIHQFGGRQSKPFVPVNCAALTATLAESQLFGHEKGAFTGALGASLGVFRSAEGGVVFLDEIGEMPLELQPKLLRVLQENEVTPVGSAHPVPINVQVVAATNRNLEEEVEAGNFREDLYFRLNMVELQVPSLRQRIDDLPEFIQFFSRIYAAKYQRSEWTPDSQTLLQFMNYHWPGNIRQLSHVIEQSYVLDCAPILPNRKS
ncbi:MAG: sigma-54-dependent Fis family transcriptional regulator, partial [Planctomycetales bacterium]|nr:sigma-54-dependent Fis family transcriptional regulator [Planctomycetales bacterium]